MKTAACYIRVSTDDQLEFSPDAQKRALLEYAKKNDLIVSDEFIFIDEGISGRKAEKRPAFMRMISTAKVKPRPFDVILVHKFDRFARNREDSVVYKSLLRKEYGVQVVSITEHMEDDKFSVILEAMLEAMAEYYSLNLSDEVIKGMTEKARRGGILGRAPYGYQNNGKGNPPVIVPEEAEMITMMFERIHSREMTPFTLARYLNTTGRYTRNGRSWGVYTLKYLLSNPFYAGLSVWNRQTRATMRYKDQSEWIVTEGQHEAIIDKTIFDEVQTILAENKKRRERPAAQYCHWLSGIVKCSSCGGSLSVSTRTSPFFQCHRYNKGNCDQSHYIAVHALEKAVIDSLQEFVQNPSDSIHYEKRPTFNADVVDRLSVLHASLKRAQEKLNRIRSAFAEGIDTLDEYRENKHKISNEITSIQAEIEKTKPLHATRESFLKTQQGIIQVLDTVISTDCTIEEKNASLKSLVGKIIFDKRTKEIEVFYYYD